MIKQCTKCNSINLLYYKNEITSRKEIYELVDGKIDEKSKQVNFVRVETNDSIICSDCETTLVRFPKDS